MLRGIDMESFVAALRAQGYKVTPQRRAVIEALQGCGKFSTAQQVLELVRRQYPDMSLDTVYRNLSLLVELGLVHEVRVRGREGNVFEIAINGHHHHLVCLKCGKTECLDFCPIHDQDLVRAQAGGFKITAHSLEFYGYCIDCRKVSLEVNKECTV